MNKINKYILMGATALSLGIGSNDIKAQTADTTQKIGRNDIKAQTTDTTQKICEDFLQKEYIIVNNDLPEKIENHEDFITTRIDKIFKLYGKEKGLELINQHMLIEINKFREENGKPPLNLDPEIQDLSQARAEHLYNENSCEHGKGNDSLRARIQEKDIKGVIGAGENICQGFYTIKDAHNAFKTSETGHRDLLLIDECNFCGVGVECSNIWNNDETGNTVFIGDNRYHQSNKPFRLHLCVTIIHKKEPLQEEKIIQTEE